MMGVGGAIPPIHHDALLLLSRISQATFYKFCIYSPTCFIC